MTMYGPCSYTVEDISSNPVPDPKPARACVGLDRQSRFPVLPANCKHFDSIEPETRPAFEGSLCHFAQAAVLANERFLTSAQISVNECRRAANVRLSNLGLLNALNRC